MKEAACNQTASSFILAFPFGGRVVEPLPSGEGIETLDTHDFVLLRLGEIIDLAYVSVREFLHFFQTIAFVVF